VLMVQQPAAQQPATAYSVLSANRTFDYVGEPVKFVAFVNTGLRFNDTAVNRSQ
jgi:hypothetical protein